MEACRKTAPRGGRPHVGIAGRERSVGPDGTSRGGYLAREGAPGRYPAVVRHGVGMTRPLRHLANAVWANDGRIASPSRCADRSRPSPAMGQALHSSGNWLAQQSNSSPGVPAPHVAGTWCGVGCRYRSGVHSLQVLEVAQASVAGDESICGFPAL